MTFVALCAIALVTACTTTSIPGTSPVLDAGPLRVAVLMPPLPNNDTNRVEMQMAVERVNEAGGIAGGRELVLEPFSYEDDASRDNAVERILADDGIAAVIGPGRSSDVMAVAPAFIAAERVLVSPTSTADEVLRAYAGGHFIWRTKESDIGQTELLVHYAVEVGASRIALLTSDDTEGQTAFNWFGFFATENGFDESEVHVSLLAADSCEESATAALDAGAEVLFAAVGTHSDVTCIIQAWSNWREVHDSSTARLVFADVGLDYTQYGGDVGMSSHGVEGFASTSPEGSDFEEELATWSGSEHVPPNAASAFDAVLLVAYGLQESEGEGGDALGRAMVRVVDGRGEPVSYDVNGVRTALSAIAAGEHPDISGATGTLTYEPSLYVDLAESTFGRWAYNGADAEFEESYFTGDPTLLTASKALVGPSDAASFTPETAPGYEPTEPAEHVKALIASFSSGWSNYRHQADVLRQYQNLRAAGLSDDDIILIGADDLSDSVSNVLPGTVRNDVDGDNLYVDVQYDYDPSELSAAELLAILSGEAGEATPNVLSLDAQTNLYVFLAGHGGTAGMPIGASTAAEGLSTDGSSKLLTPTALREALCALKGRDAYRRAVIVIEASYSGVFGALTHNGLAMGCGGDGVTPSDPLYGTLLVTAANTAEVSFAAQHDTSLNAWVADDFSHTFAASALTSGSDGAESYYDLLVGVGNEVIGAHPSVYNEGPFGDLRTLTFAEFMIVGPMF